MAQQRMSDYIDKIHGRAFVGEHFSEDDLRHDDEEALAPSLAPKAASTVASKASPQAPAKATATKGQMEDAQRLLAFALELSRKQKASSRLAKNPLPEDMI